RAEDRNRLPADHGHGDGDVRCRVPARLTDRGPAAARHRLGDRRGRAVLAVPADRAQQLCGRGARPDDGDGGRDRADVRPMSLVSLTKVPDGDAGVASSLLNTGQQVGGSIGLAVLGTVAWSAVASSLRTGAPQAHALAYGFSRGFVVSAAITLLTAVVALVMLRVKREDLAGINPMAAPAA